MKTIRSAITSVILACSLAGLQAQEKAVEVDGVPQSTDDFIALRDKLSVDPEGGAAVFVLAMMAYISDQDLGEQFFTIALDRSKLQPSVRGYKGFKPERSMDYFLDRLAKNPYWPTSYVEGSSPEENYKVESPFQFTFTRNKYSEISSDRIKVFIACSGADTPRPITLQKNNRGIWKALEYSSLFVGMRAPGKPADDDL